MNASIDLTDPTALADFRRDLHMYPELGFEETRTAARVADALRALGLDVAEGIAGTGVVATLHGSGPTVGLRADMDALAMGERPGRPWASRVAGRMHACGHDGHTTMLLGAAARLAADPPGPNVHFIFQPAEEGRGGARKMIEEGLFDRFACDFVFGLHNMTDMPPDRMAVTKGAQLASSDSWRVVFHGVGSHGAKPHQGRDALTAAAQFVALLQTIPGRVIDPLQPAIVSACAFQAGDMAALNVIPADVSVGGTARAYDPGVRDSLEAEIGRLAHGIAAANGVVAQYDFIRRIPPVINDADATAIALRAARRVAAGGVDQAFPPSTAGDDFAFFAQTVPGAYVWLGNGAADAGGQHHNPGYDFNDAAIPTGVSFWVEVVREVARL